MKIFLMKSESFLTLHRLQHNYQVQGPERYSSKDVVTCQLRCCLWRVRKLSDFIKNIFICVPKMNEGLTGLERHKGE